MRFLTISLVSSLCFISLVIVDQGIATQLTGSQSTNSKQQVLIGNGNQNRTSYRGSGRREILASPRVAHDDLAPLS
jgi:hypothetical protein